MNFDESDNDDPNGFSTFNKSGEEWTIVNPDGSNRKMTDLQRKKFEQLVKESKQLCEEMKADELER